MHDIDSQGFVRKVPDIALVKRIATPILNRIDREVVRTSDIVLTPSKKDAVLLERIVPNISHKSIIPIKLNLQLFWEAPPVTSVSTIGFFGAMFRPENYTAVEWFLDNVWENIKKEGFVFEIAGEGLPLHLKDRISAIEGVTYLGFVENLETFVTQCDLFVAPLKSGAGIKFKVLQAISAGRPVLGSEIAFEGIDNKNVLKRCETPKDYIDLLLTLKNDVNLLSGLSKKSVYLATEFTSQGKTTAEVIKSM